MMALELLSTLEALNITLTAHGPDLVISPASLLSEPLRVAIRARKPELLLLGLRACSWEVRTPEREFRMIAVPAVSRAEVLRQNPDAVSAEVAQSCARCLHEIRPGAARYCTSEARTDLPKGYGPGHPARALPADSGASCDAFEAHR